MSKWWLSAALPLFAAVAVLAEGTTRHAWQASPSGVVAAPAGGASASAGSCFPAVFSLAAVDGTYGFVMAGLDTDQTGFSSSAAGDVNGDTVADVIVGAHNDIGQPASVVLGRTTARSVLSRTTLDPADGFSLATDGSFSSTGVGAADFNADGLADVLMGAEQADFAGANAGATYVVFGRPSHPLPVSLFDLNGTDGFRLDGVDIDERSGRSVSGAGDFNGDGIDDIVIGAPGNTASARGKVYIVSGTADPMPAVASLADFLGAGGLRLDGAELGDACGTSVAGAGDFNGDGIDDVIVGAPGFGTAGAAFVVFGYAGPLSGSLDLGMLSGSNGFRLDGVAASERAGFSVAAAGDVNGDGLDDIVIGAPALLSATAGRAYIVFGQSGALPAVIDLSTLDGSLGFRLASSGAFGQSVSGAGDVNGDGIDDLIVGNPFFTPPGGSAAAGAAYVVFGRTTGFPALLDASTLDGTNGFRLDGIGHRYWTGHSVAGVGDINDDGVDDIVIGAVGASRAYVVYGCPPCELPDADGDGVPACQDCNDADPTIYPGAVEIPCDGIDQNCNGFGDEEPDRDGDGVSICDGDCDDEDPTRRPGIPDICNGIDDDCDGIIDDGATDDDSDGVCDPEDNCPLTHNPTQADRDGDGIGDACEPPPDLTCPPGAIVQCGSPIPPPQPSAVVIVDHCGGPTTTTVTSATTGAGTCTEIITRTYVVTDACGHSSSCQQTLAVLDTIPPELTAPPDAVLECPADTSPASTGIATATDACLAGPVVAFMDAVATGCGGERIVTRTWTATDACGNSSSHAQVIHVVDTTPPVLAGPPDIVLECGADTSPASTGMATATDGCDAAPAVTFTDVVTPGCGNAFSIVRTWTAADACGNASSDEQIVVVQDTTPPVLAAPSDMVLECPADTSPASTGMATATDGCDAAPAVTFTDVVTPGCGNTLSIVRTWTAVDACGNSSSAEQLIIVQDTTPPVITASDANDRCLWPPRHDAWTLTVDDFAILVVDACDAAATWRFEHCESDQPDDSTGDGSTVEDCVVAEDGQSVQVRAERQGAAPSGRAYRIGIVATDACGNSTSPTDVATIRVPRDAREHARCPR